jgi:hypothetical protein
MKKLSRLFTAVIVLAMVCGVFANTGVARASVPSSARTAHWIVSVTYQNVGNAPTAVQVTFYAENSTTPIVFDPLSGGNLNAGAGASFFAGSVGGLTSGFRGNAIMSASQPLVATVVQFSQDPGFKMRLLYNGFQSADASNQYLVATTLRNQFDRTTVFSIQNTESEAITATVRFYRASDGGLQSTVNHAIPANSSKYIELDNPAHTGALTDPFNGSAIVTAVKQAGGSANVVAAASEYYTNRDVAANFEGLPLVNAATKIYLATGLCQRFGLDTFYAVQNASLTDSTNITVSYFNTDGSPKSTDGPYPLSPGQKKSIITCSPSSGTNMANFTGSAVINSTVAPIVAIGKAQVSGLAPDPNTTDVFTAFLGERAGASRLALPFVRWASQANFDVSTGGKQRAFIAIQNLELSSAKVNVKYYDKNGGLVATQVLTIPANSKGNSDANAAGALGQNGMNAGEFGYYTDGSFGGAVIVEAHSDNPSAKFIAIARVQNPGAGEDYNAVAAP